MLVRMGDDRGHQQGPFGGGRRPLLPSLLPFESRILTTAGGELDGTEKGCGEGVAGSEGEHEHSVTRKVQGRARGSRLQRNEGRFSYSPIESGAKAEPWAMARFKTAAGLPGCPGAGLQTSPAASDNRSLGSRTPARRDRAGRSRAVTRPALLLAGNAGPDVAQSSCTHHQSLGPVLPEPAVCLFDEQRVCPPDGHQHRQIPWRGGGFQIQGSLHGCREAGVACLTGSGTAA